MTADAKPRERSARSSYILGLAFGAALLAFAPAVARADQASDDAAALMQTAADAYGKGDYATCRTKATEAWSKFQHAQIAGLLGSCEVKLGMYADGATHLDFYLKSSTGDVNPDAKKLLEDAKQHVSEVTLSCHPEGVTFTVDNKPLPIGAQTVFLDPGQHLVGAEKEGYVPKETPQAIAAGTKVTVNIQLEPKGGGGGKASALPLWPGEISIAIGGLAIGTGIGLIGASSGADTTATAQGKGLKCNPASLSAACQTLSSAVSRHNAFGNAAIGMFIVGGVFAATGLIYLPLAITNNKSIDEKKAASLPVVLPIVTNNFGGVVASGRF